MPLVIFLYIFLVLLDGCRISKISHCGLRQQHDRMWTMLGLFQPNQHSVLKWPKFILPFLTFWNSSQTEQSLPFCNRIHTYTHSTITNEKCAVAAFVCVSLTGCWFVILSEPISGLRRCLKSSESVNMP